MENPFVFGNIKVNDGNIIARTSNQLELGEKLDELVLLVLDYGLNDNIVVSSVIFGNTFFLN